ncbi:MAG: AAA family ATPase [Oligoflexia bacterium]|nr:AAA family ATPase [Oligoflexia bacterium]
MIQTKLHSLYGLKWNPFSGELPIEALIKTPKINHFAWKIENLVLDGGFALITGDSGLGKSTTCRLLHDKFNQINEIKAVEFSRPQSGLTDFYRELGLIFGIDLRSSNKYGGFQKLREKWSEHIKKTLLRPILFLDEAQEAPTSILSELRLLGSTRFDSKIILTVVLCGDKRMLRKLDSEDLHPLENRIRTRLIFERYSREESIDLLHEALERAGNPTLMTKGLIETLADSSMGNPRTMMSIAQVLLLKAAEKELKQISEDLYIEMFSNELPKKKKK